MLSFVYFNIDYFNGRLFYDTVAIINNIFIRFIKNGDLDMVAIFRYVMTVNLFSMYYYQSVNNYCLLLHDKDT